MIHLYFNDSLAILPLAVLCLWRQQTFSSSRKHSCKLQRQMRDCSGCQEFNKAFVRYLMTPIHEVCWKKAGCQIDFYLPRLKRWVQNRACQTQFRVKLTKKNCKQENLNRLEVLTFLWYPTKWNSKSVARLMPYSLGFPENYDFPRSRKCHNSQA